jgi:DNA-directed RNA polymerase subunit RPC12/RpoP
MGLLDNISRTIQQGVDRAKFEAEKFQKTTRLQGEINEYKRQLDAKLMELGQRAYDLQRAGQINAVSIAQLSANVDQLRAALLAKEEELNLAQNDNFPEPPAPPAPPSAQQVPISYEAPPTVIMPPPATPQAGAQKTCPNCGFQMPGTAIFCPNCGTRVAG